MSKRISDEELVKHFRGLFGEGREESRAAERDMAIMAVACVVALILIAIAIICVIVLLPAKPAHAGVVPSWSPAQTQAGDWLAIYYICGLLIIFSGVGIYRFLRGGDDEA